MYELAELWATGSRDESVPLSEELELYDLLIDEERPISVLLYPYAQTNQCVLLTLKGLEDVAVCACFEPKAVTRAVVLGFPMTVAKVPEHKILEAIMRLDRGEAVDGEYRVVALRN